MINRELTSSNSGKFGKHGFDVKVYIPVVVYRNAPVGQVLGNMDMDRAWASLKSQIDGFFQNIANLGSVIEEIRLLCRRGKHRLGIRRAPRPDVSFNAPLPFQLSDEKPEIANTG